MAGGQGRFRDGFGSKLACIRAAKELFSTLVRGSHAVAWMGSKLQPSGSNCVGFQTIAWVSTLLRSPCTPSNLQLQKAITSSSELCFECS